MKLKNLIKNYKESLFTVNKEPLTPLSKFFLLVFVLFSVVILVISLSQQGRTIAMPSEKFGFNCISFVSNYDNKLNIEEFKYKKHILDFGSDKGCKTLAYLYQKTRQELSPILRELTDKKRQLSILESRKIALKSEYSNTLLEKIAKQSKEKSILNASADNIKEKIAGINKKISNLNGKIKLLEKEAKKKNSYLNFKNYLNQNAQIIKNRYDKYVKFQSLRVLASKYLFLIPLFVAVFLLYNFAIKREKYILSHLLINLLNVVGIFILFYLLEFIYNIIPHTLLQKFYNLLYKLNIIAFANYISIALFVVIFGLLIKFIQNRAKKQKELKQSLYKFNYIKEGKCPNCGAFKDKSYKFCPSCGEKLYAVCKECGKDKIAQSPYCQECGAEEK